MIPVHGYAVARGDMIDVRTVSSTELGSVTKWLDETQRGFSSAMPKDQTMRLFHHVAGSEDAHVVAVVVTDARPARKPARVADQPEVEEGEW